MKRRNLMLCWALIAAFFGNLHASPKTDSIAAFLGGANAKFIWMRWAWCNDNYQPKTKAAATAEGWSMMLMDTKAGTERTLVTGCSSCALMQRISRMGTWATYIQGTTTYIVDLNVASPTKKVLMSKSDCTYWAVGTFWVDPANGTEYVYCHDNADFPCASDGGGNGIYKVKLNSDGTVDKSTATKLTINGLSGNPSVDRCFSVSGDGKKIGGAFPWPNTAIVDVAAGRIDYRHSGTFGCQSNIAPDNSYRFFHCDGDHFFIWMFDANMGTANWQIPFNHNLVGLTGGANPNFLAPRWSNHLQYYTCTWPMDGDGNGYVINGFNDMGDEAVPWGQTANWVQTQIDMNRVTQFYLGKFSSDFKSQEKTIAIARDPRYFQGRGDAWICNGTTYGSQCSTVSTLPAIRSENLRGLSVAQSGAFLNVHADAAATVRIADARGRIVRMWCGTGNCRLDSRALAAGAYLVSVTTGERSASIRLPVTGVSR